MSLLDNLREALRTKEPSFPVTRSQSWDDYTYLTKQTNYFDQYFGWTYRASLINAQSVASYPLRLYKGTRDKYVEVFSDTQQLLKDLEFFNPYMHLYEARLLRELHVSLTGSAFWAMFTSETKGHRWEYYALDPTRVRISTDGKGLPKGYIYSDPSGQEYKLALEDVIVFKQTNPANWLTGHSVLQASRLPHNTWELAEKFNMNVFGNMSRPEGIISLENANSDEVKAFEKMFKAKYGKVRNAGKMAFLNTAVTFLKLTENQRDLQYVEGIREMRDEILAFHGVYKPLVGLTDSTFTNSAEAQRMYQRYTLKPKLIAENEVCNFQILPKYFLGAEKYMDLFFITADPVENDKKEASEVARGLYSDGIIKLNEARESVGYESLGDEGDIFKAPPTPLLPTPVEPVTPIEPKKEVKDKSIFKGEMKRIKELRKGKETLAEIRTRDKAELKEVFAKLFETREAKFADVSKKFLLAQSKRIIDGLGLPNKSITINYNIDWAKENAKARTEYAEIYKEIMLVAWTDASELTGLNTGVTVGVEKLVSDRLDQFVSEINATTRKEITKLISRAIEEGWTETQLAQQLQDKFDRWANGGEDIKQSRAETFARTEVGTVMSISMMSNYRASGVVPEKEWLSSRDKFVRSWHREENIMPSFVVKIDEPFIVHGELLDAPKIGWQGSMPSGENVIACRCVALPIVSMSM